MEYILIFFLLLGIIALLHRINNLSALYKCQEEELKLFALIIKKIRLERDVLLEIAAKYKIQAESIPDLQFNKDQIQTMLMLCHPDKHGGKESAVRITQVLIKLREEMK